VIWLLLEVGKVSIFFPIGRLILVIAIIVLVCTYYTKTIQFCYNNQQKHHQYRYNFYDQYNDHQLNMQYEK